TYYDAIDQAMVTRPIERRLAAINGELNGTINDSLAVIMQSFILNENIVGTLGWRQDEVTNNLANTPLLLGAIDQATKTRLGVVNDTYENEGLIAENADGEYLFEDSVLTVVKEDIFSWGAVAKLPQKWNPISGLVNHASLFYSSSSNFQPAPGREDHLGRQLPSPTGTTEDYGINLSLLDDKYTIRINKFEAAINNADNPGVNRVFAQATNEAVRGLIQNWYNQLATDDFTATVEDESSPYFGQFNNYPKAQSEALLNEYLAFLGITIDRYSGNVTLDPNNPRSALWVENGWRAEFNSGLGVVDGIGQTAGGKTDTVDQVSKGYEFEMIANPVKGLRVLLNVAKVETANSNVAPIMRAWIEEEFGPYHAGTPANPSVIGALIRGNPARRPEIFPNAVTNTTQYFNEVVRDWEVLKAQEGTFTPEIRKWRYNAVVNYDFQEGFLKGFGTGFNVRYQSRVAIGFPINPDAEGIPKPDIAHPFYGPSEIDWGFRFAYSRRIF
ncbi:MAG: hypothetical protein KJT03_21955, partial [Verrucomicrobiae bacterium]|nr:hypothetical protein [Verrucomicrobiae bacterium]